MSDATTLDVAQGAGAAKDMGIWGISTNLPQTIAPLAGGGLLVALSPFGTVTGYSASFLLAAACSAGSGALGWRLQGIR
jgi:hypothetical protein